VVGIVFGGRFLTRPIFRWIAQSRSNEVFIATTLLLVIGITLAMQLVGLSPALGTFLAGVVLADSEYRHELEANIEPFKGLLLGLFFISVGASINFPLVADAPLLILGLVALLIGIKFPLLLLLGRVFRLNLADNLMFAFILAQGGEFAFLLFSFATQNRVMSADLVNIMVAVVALSMMLTPLMIMAYEHWVRPRFIDCAAAPPGDETIDAGPNRVIIAGYGRFGQVVSRMLTADGVETTLLDNDASQIELTARFGQKVFYGDALRIELLRAAGAERAQLLVIAFGSRQKSVDLVNMVRSNFPQLKILARAYDRAHAYQLMAAGVHFVMRESFGSALLVGERALQFLGSSEERAYRVMRLFKKHDEAGLEKMYELWGDERAYGLGIRQALKDLEQVLKDDLEDSVKRIP
jgi:voltage-gated potassium channel Kch